MYVCMYVHRPGLEPGGFKFRLMWAGEKRREEKRREPARWGLQFVSHCMVGLLGVVMGG